VNKNYNTVQHNGIYEDINRLNWFQLARLKDDAEIITYL